METYLEILQRWGVPVTKEDFIVPGVATRTGKRLGYGQRSSRCLHGVNQEHDISTQQPVGVDTVAAHMRESCLGECAPVDVEGYPDYRDALLLGLSAEVLENLNYYTSRPDALDFTIVLRDPIRMLALERTSERFNLDLVEAFKEHILKNRDAWRGREMRLFEDVYGLRFDTSVEVYAEVYCSSPALSDLLSAAFIRVAPSLFRMPKVINAELRNPPAEEDGRERIFSKTAAFPAVDADYTALYLHVGRQFEIPAAFSSVVSEFDETLGVLCKEMKLEAAFQSASAIVST